MAQEVTCTGTLGLFMEPALRPHPAHSPFMILAHTTTNGVLEPDITACFGWQSKTTLSSSYGSRSRFWIDMPSCAHHKTTIVYMTPIWYNFSFRIHVISTWVTFLEFID
ncbi:hypothetical protein PRUPE_4G187000 [Prunus persica]|uniref:Uncharacterized protein n=1 Tax=Prunus persica TaxID=3760 RepID=A0A251PMQ6_PRUPE|nr:hypothetical protein PRUPE_4G187000 [Prunus persica]